MKLKYDKLNSWVKKFLVYFFIIATIISLAFLYPTRAQFSYEYSIGTTWQNEDLKSNFDFPIIRDADEISEEKNKIKESYIPRFKKKDSNFKNQISYVDNLILDSLPNNKISQFKTFLKRELSKIYKTGVISNEDFKKIKNSSLILVNGNKVKKISSDKILTPNKAKDKLFNSTNIYFHSLLNVVDNLDIYPNYAFDTELNNKLLEDQLSKISPNIGVFKKDSFIIKKNELVTANKAKTLNSYKAAFTREIGENKSKYLLHIGYFILSLIILGTFLFFLYVTERDIYSKPRKLLFLLIWILLFSYSVFFIDNNGELYVYAIPFTLVPIILLNFYKKYLALYIHITIILIASLITKLGYEFTVLQLLVGMVTILVFSELRFWNTFFRGILVIFLTYIVGYISLFIINSTNFSDIDWRIIISFFVNAMLLLLAYPLIPLIEKPFGYISKITVSELGDLNKPLLKELSLKSPGTLQHSLQVANLCEAAAEKIGANSLLIKVGALYHDIGKTYAPEFFIENQRKGENPYENLDYFDSANRIIKHITEGEKMAIKNRLPKMLQRFIVTHHGTTRVEYFYRKQMNEFPDKEFDETLFRYPGPKPKTKEESILMIADSIEAAAKSLNKPGSKDIDDLVENITKYKIDEGQLQESELTFEELEEIKEVFKSMLKNIHHIRIEYPKLKNDNNQN